ncbi:transposase [Okeania sp.]|uniref:IS4/Tn5 family transposase DNA-binding protein n=1 Tax=Okeania sp. TaxID=3100323 RepID=UPI002B4AC722|nr:transposase [Okeania sp.]
MDSCSYRLLPLKITNMEKWILKELGRTDLGDKRRTKRFMEIVSNLSNSPSATVPTASRTWAATKATYDFWDSPYIQPSMIRQRHIEATQERISQHQVVFIGHTRHHRTQLYEAKSTIWSRIS